MSDIANIPELQIRVSKGDNIAFEEFVDAYYQGLYSYAYQFLRDKMDAEELVLDVFVIVWQKRQNLINIKNIKSYLYKSVKNKVIDFSRANKNVNNISLDSTFDTSKIKISYTPEAELISKEEIDKINEAIEFLPKRCREVIYLIKNEQLSYKEVAEVMSISVKTVENQMTIALNKLSEKLGVDKKNHKKRANIMYVLFL